jgi:hypothetical protein
VIYLLTVAAVLVLAGLYWYRRWRVYPAGIKRAISYPLAAVLIAAVLLLISLERMDRSYLIGDNPLLIALVLDLSLSMGTMPDPREHGDVGTRMARIQGVLMPILNALDASGAQAMISITGFTAAPETFLGWDDNLPQTREVVEYVIAPGMLTEPGSDLGAALQGVVPLFDNLPEAYRGEDVNKFMIVVSDGEQTLDKSDMATALADIRAKQVKSVALHVGTADVPEGLPVYDQIGSFLGFQDIGGQIYSVPDTETMMLVAGNDTERGIYVKAEDTNAVGAISNFIGVRVSAAATSSPLYLGSILALWALGFAILLWFV